MAPAVLPRCDAQGVDLRVDLRLHVIRDEKLDGLSSGDGVLECCYPIIDEHVTDLFGLLPSLEGDVRTSPQNQLLGTLLIERCGDSNGARVYVGG